MGYYLNSSKALSLYESEVRKPYFVDKTKILTELIPLVQQENNHICITRPRRFGKSVMAAMVGAFFTRGIDSHSVFDKLAISKDPLYRECLNQYDVIFIDFSEEANVCGSYEEFIRMVQKTLQSDLRTAFPDVIFRAEESVVQDLRRIQEETGTKFILVFDEWDCIFHKKTTSDEDRRKFLSFLAALTKGTGYVLLTYMTGILPIAKYSSGSALNHFEEYTMAGQPKFSRYFGFTDDEVDELYDRYLRQETAPEITREDLRFWYDGYHTAGHVSLYNPRSVVSALMNNHLSSYWTRTGPYSEISRYIVNDVDGVKRDLALMVDGESVRADIEEYAATEPLLTTKDEIFSAMVVYGFLNFDQGKVRIPNKELMDEFERTIRREKNLGYVYNLACLSERMLEATLNGDTATMEEILQTAHDTETPILDYNREEELAAVVNLVYLAARDSYRVEREEKSGKGYADFLFYPENPEDDGMILELKVDDTPEAAVRQIREKNYAAKLRGKLAERKKQVRRILAVGISYSRKDKQHHCRVEEIEG